MTWESFKQRPQPADVDDKYHVFDKANALNVLYWDHLFELTEPTGLNNIFEFGVGRGRSLISMLSVDHYRRISNLKPANNFFAFDSFEGFPHPTIEDDSFRKPKRGEWSKSPSGKYEYSPEFVSEILELSGFDVRTRVNFVKGFFADTIPFALGLDLKIRILHLDGDLYNSVFDPLNALAKNVGTGGIVVFDDFKLESKNSEKDAFPGARKAMEDFMKINSNDFMIQTTPRGNPYLVKI